MAYKYFSLGGEILPVEKAVIPLNNVEYSYGFGVYETIRVSKGVVYFLENHCQRLIASAKIIGLEHTFAKDFIQSAVIALAKKNDAETCNVKMLLIGGNDKTAASLYIMCLNPLFPDRKLYKEGAACTTYQYERAFPGAKTLNMLQSYLAYKGAKAAGAYDALLINRRGYITEGTRTNFFALQSRTIISPKAKDILPGVTKKYVLETALKHGFEVLEQDIKLTDINKFDGAFLTSTPSKIVPIRSIDGRTLWHAPSAALQELMTEFDEFLNSYNNGTYILDTPIFL